MPAATDRGGPAALTRKNIGENSGGLFVFVTLFFAEKNDVHSINFDFFLSDLPAALISTSVLERGNRKSDMSIPGINRVLMDETFCSQKDASGMRFGSGDVGETRQDVQISSSKIMNDQKGLATTNISPITYSQGRDNQVFKNSDATTVSPKASKPDIREANRSHMRAKRTSDEAYRQRERILNRERMRRLRAGRRQEQEAKKHGGEPIQVVQAYAIPFEINKPYELPQFAFIQKL